MVQKLLCFEATEEKIIDFEGNTTRNFESPLLFPTASVASINAEDIHVQVSMEGQQRSNKSNSTELTGKETLNPCEGEAFLKLYK